MTKNELRLSIAIGIVFATFALIMLSFTMFMDRIESQMLLEKQIKHDLIEKASMSCDPVYPVVHAAIYLDRVIVECRTE